MAIKKFAETPKGRRANLNAFARILGATPNGSGFVCGTSTYIILHYNLMTDRPKPGAGDALRGAVEKEGGTRIDGSVWVIPLRKGESARAASHRVWNAVASATKGLMTEGDLVYLHRSAVTNELRALAQGVKANSTSLPRVR